MSPYASTKLILTKGSSYKSPTWGRDMD